MSETITGTMETTISQEELQDVQEVQQADPVEVFEDTRNKASEVKVS